MAKKRKFRGFDPAESARKLAERERYTRNTPSAWGLNRDALAMPQNREVEVIAPTRERVSRVTRYDCFVTLNLPVPAYMAVRRYQDTLATIHRCEGSDHMSAKVDGGGSRELLNARWIEASNERASLHDMMTPCQAELIEQLSLHTVVLGQQPNWQAIAGKVTGLVDRDALARAVKLAAEAVRAAYAELDNGSVRRAA